jgi:hypothetical protein
MAANPWLKRLLLPNANQAYNLYALMQAADATLAWAECSKLQIQFDVDAGAARFKIGNEDISATEYGVQLVASQAWGIEAIEQNLIFLKNIWVFCDTADQYFSVAMVVH